MGTSSRRPIITKIKRILETPDLDIDQAVTSISQSIMSDLPDSLHARHRTRYFDSTMLNRAIGVGINTAKNLNNPSYFSQMGIAIPELSDQKTVQNFIEAIIEREEEHGEIEEAVHGALRQGLIETVQQNVENREEFFISTFFANLIQNLLETLSAEAIFERFGPIPPEEMDARFRLFAEGYVRDNLKTQADRCMQGEITISDLVAAVLATFRLA